MGRSRLVVLLPARNAAGDLDGWFETVERFADAVVALDDGSTDDTAARLEAHPLVARLLRNPVRADYVGWDDAGNRNRLLEVAVELSPDWILSLDADERIDADDGAALRRLVDGEGDREHAYLFRVFRMIEDTEHYDEDQLWVGRLFPFRAGQRFPTERLHFVALPVEIPRDRWRRTTVRIQHLSSLTAQLRAARFAKYVEADPDRAYQATYDHLLRDDLPVRGWEARPPFLPSVVNGRTSEPAVRDADPVASVVLIARDDERIIEGAVGAVVAQTVDEPFEVILATSGSDGTADLVRRRFPAVHVVALDRPAMPGEARNAGLAVARGEIVIFHGSHVQLVPGSVAARIRAHRSGWAMVSGSVENGTRTLAGWASYFLDHAWVLPTIPSAPAVAPPGSCSYLRAVLDVVGRFPPDLRAGEDTAVNEALFRLGYGGWRERDAGYVHHSPCATVRVLVRHHYQRGRGRGRLLVAGGPPLRSRPFLREHLVLHVPRRVRGVTRLVLRSGRRYRVRFALSLPLVVVGAVAHWAGMWRELAARR